MQVQSSYLRNLKFDEKLRNSFVAKYLSNPRLLVLILFSIIGIGLFSFFTLPRVLNPEIKIPIVIVSTVLPGASPEDIESLITIPIENSISGVNDVKTTTSTSRESVSVVQLEFNSSVDPDKARTDVQAAIDSAELPGDAQNPRVQKLDFENQPVWTFAVTSQTGDTASLIRFAEDLSDKIEDLNSVETVQTSGVEEQEIQIYIQPDVLTSYGLNLQQVAQAISSSLNSFPAGTVTTDTSSFSVSIDPASVNLDQLRNTYINLNGNVVALDSIATISERSKPNQNVSYYARPDSEVNSAVTLNVFRNKNININQTVSEVEHLVEEELNRYNNQFQTQSILNASEEIDHQFGELTRDFTITIIFMFLILLVFLGIRQAIVSSLTIPLTFFISFTVMLYAGITLNFLSLFSLLLSLGLLVDDAIVVISAMTAYHRTGKFTPLETGLLVWRDFLVAIFTTTITTVWAFLPLLLAGGIIGEFIKSIPIVVSTTLIASFFVAMLITLPLIIYLLQGGIPRRVSILLRTLVVGILIVSVIFLLPKDAFFIPTLLVFFLWLILTYALRTQIFTSLKKRFTNNKNQSSKNKSFRRSLVDGFIHFELISQKYKRIIHSIIASSRKRRLTILMVLVFSLFSYILLPLGFVKNEFFPKSDVDTVYVTVELPSGTNLETSKNEARTLLSEFKLLPDIQFVSAQTSSSFSETGGPGGGESNTILFSLVLVESSIREHTSIELAQRIRDQYQGYTTGTLSVTEVTGGPPAGSDLQIKLFGGNLTQLDEYAGKIQNYLTGQPGVINVNKSVKSGTSKIVFVPDPQKIAESGLTPEVIGFLLRTYASGFTVDQAKFDGLLGNEQDITIRLSTNSQTPEDILTLNLPTEDGLIPLASLGTIRLDPSPTLITREDGRRTLSVTAGVTQGYSITDSNQELEAFADSLNLPSGYSWSTGGVNEENQNSVNSILQAMLLSFLLIVITMVLQFASFRKALIVMLVIPLSISGVFIIFALTRTPLSFPALIGVLALFGIVVKNSILVVDKIDQNIKLGMDFDEAVSDGSSSRLEAIALTSLTAIVGLTPITLSDPLWRGLGGAIIAGLAFSGSIMLFFIPVVYSYWMKPAKESSQTTKHRSSSTKNPQTIKENKTPTKRQTTSRKRT